MTVTAQLADGRTLEFPDGTDEAVIQATVRKMTSPTGEVTDSYSTNPTEGMSWWDKITAGAGKSLNDLGTGTGQVSQNMMRDQVNMQRTSRGLPPVEMPDTFVDDIDAAKARDAPLMETGAGLTGNIIGTAATAIPAMAIPGANTYTGATVLGGVLGALQPTGTGDSRAENAALGMGGGWLGQLGGNTIARLFDPQTRKSVANLLRRGVTPTPGQILGGGYQKVESAAESIPFLGQGIKDAKLRANDEFNTATLNHVLAPLRTADAPAPTVSGAGHTAVAETGDLVSQAYDDAIARVPVVRFDDGFTEVMDQISKEADSLTPAHKGQLTAILNQRLFSRIRAPQPDAPAPTIQNFLEGSSPKAPPSKPYYDLSGEEVKGIESEIRSLARQYSNSADPDQRQLSAHLEDVVDEIHNAIRQADPEAGRALDRADAAWARLVRVEKAAGMQGAPDGVFTPAQLGGAIRALDGSTRKRSIARGTGLMQEELSTPGREVLGEKLPNSGTADRYLNAGALAALLTGSVGGAPVVGALAGRAAYTEPGQKLLAALLARRTPALRKTGQYIRRATPIAAGAGAEVTAQ